MCMQNKEWKYNLHQDFKKAIAAAFQANFKGTEEEEEIDPQSKHISHYRWGAKWSEDVHAVALFI